MNSNDNGQIHQRNNRGAPKVYYLMRKVNADCASGEIYLSSPAPASVVPGYHKILKSVKGSRIIPPSGEPRAAAEVYSLTRGDIARVANE